MSKRGLNYIVMDYITIQKTPICISNISSPTREDRPHTIDRKVAADIMCTRQPDRELREAVLPQ